MLSSNDSIPSQARRQWLHEIVRSCRPLLPLFMVVCSWFEQALGTINQARTTILPTSDLPILHFALRNQ
jgi:hypothetical protein